MLVYPLRPGHLSAGHVPELWKNRCFIYLARSGLYVKWTACVWVRGSNSWCIHSSTVACPGYCHAGGH